MTSTNPDAFDTGRSIAEKLQADVLEENPQTYFVKYSEDDAEIEPKTPLNELLFSATEDTRRDLYDLLVYSEPITYTWTEESDTGNRLSDFLSGRETHTITVHAEDGGSYFEIEEDGNVTPVPSEWHNDIIDNIAASGDGLADAGRSLRQIRREIEDNYVDRSVVETFLDRFPEERVRVTRDGWVIDDSFVVRYDARNFLVDEASPMRNRQTADESDRFVDLEFNIQGSSDAETPHGTVVELDEIEQEFLATVEVFLNPERYLGYDLSGKIISLREGDEEPSDSIGTIASTAEDRGFRDPTVTDKSHGHSLEKHTLTASFSVTDDVIDRLHFAQNTHGAVHELTRRESEFRRADFDVFHDTTNDDGVRWREIKQRAKSAPITDEAQRKMDSMFGRS